MPRGGLQTSLGVDGQHAGPTPKRRRQRSPSRSGSLQGPSCSHPADRSIDPHRGLRPSRDKNAGARLKVMGAARYSGGFRPALHDDLIDAPKHWKTPRLIFVNSMSDLFQEAVPDDFIRRVFATMRDCPQHTFQILTKRSDRLRQLGSSLSWPPNVWMGVSVEDARVTGRIADLAAVPAHVRFLSCEPLIGPLEKLALDRIHWVIVGVEFRTRRAGNETRMG